MTASIAPIFVDDFMVSIRASTSDGNTGQDILEAFCERGGLEINFQKSGTSFSNRVRGQVKRDVKQILNMKKLLQDCKYLENPTFLKRKRA